MSFLVTRYSLFATLLIMLASCAVSADGQRYRGAYTYGHEVNIFCPEVNSHCYWLGPRTSQAVRARLKALYQEKKPGLYKPVCVVVDAVIDRDSPRDGFAADYDGLININAVLGACDTAAVITPGELNHRRWVLVEHDGIAVDAKFNPMVLDFGERLFVEITDGCRRFSGFAELDVDRIRFDRIEPDLSACEGGGPPSNLVSAGSAWQVVLEERNRLELDSGDNRLVFRRDDWR